MRIFSCLVAALALLAGSNASAAVKVIYTVKGKVFEVTAFKDQKIFGRAGSEVVELPDGGSFSIDGSDWMEDAHVLLTVKPDVTRRSFPDALEPHPRPFRVGVVIRNTIDFSEKAGAHGDMLRLWNLNPDERTLAVVIWQSGDTLPQVASKILPPANWNWYDKIVPMQRSVEQTETVGNAGMLLLGSTGFVTPRPEFSDTDAGAALRCLVRNDEAGFVALLGRRPGIASLKSITGATLLHYATMFDRSWAVAPLCKAGAKPNSLDEKDEPPLVWAAELGHASLVDALLAAGADPNKGFPLHIAIRHGHEQAAASLVQGKADLNAFDLYNESPLLAAINHNRGAIARMLTEKKAEYSAERILLNEVLCAKIASGQNTIAEIMLSHGLSPNVEASGFTPLMFASIHGNHELVGVLLKAGAKPNAKGKGDLTALLAAVQSNDLPTVRELVEAGANVTVRDENGSTVTHIAAASGDVALLVYLLEHGAPLGEKTKNGSTPLFSALLTDKRATALELQARGLGLDPKGPEFQTELEAVLRLDLAELLQPLLRSGWSADFMLYQNWPVRQVAGLFGAQRCLQLLSSAPAGAEDHLVRMASAKSVTKKPVLTAAIPLEDPRPEESSLTPGNVEVEFVIDAQGNVVFPRLTKVDDNRLRGPTLQAIQRFKYEPAYAGTEPMALQVKQVVVWQRVTRNVFSLSELDEPPIPIKRESPVYPFGAKRVGATGTVVVQFVIGVDGRVSDVEVLRSSHKLFSDAAVEAVSRWRFHPGRKGGIPVNVRANQTIPFSLTD